jgi:hypothetical protein
VVVKADAGSTIVALEVCGEVDASARPGSTRARVILTADPALGWADPEVRSVWPGTIATAWEAVELVRR